MGKESEGWLTVADGEHVMRAMGMDPDDIWRGLDAGEEPVELAKRLRAEAGIDDEANLRPRLEAAARARVEAARDHDEEPARRLRALAAKVRKGAS